MKRYLVSLFILLLSTRVFASDSAIHGTVTDTKKAILPGAAVHLNKTGGSELTTYTNGEGAFDFSNLSKGTYEVSAELDGFQTITAEVTLTDSAIRTVQIVLPEATKVNEQVTVNG